MSAKKAKKNSKGAALLDQRQKEEIAAVLLVALGVILTLSLISYSPTDPSPGSTITPPHSYDNYLGKAGANLSWALRALLGLGSYMLVLLTFAASYLFFTQRPWQIRLRQILGYLALLAAICALLHLDLPSADGIVIEKRGGVLGMALGGLLQGVFNTIGAHILLILIVLLTIIVTTGLSLAAFFVKTTGYVKSALSAAASAVTVRREKARRKREKLQRSGAAGKEGAIPKIVQTRPSPPEKKTEPPPRPKEEKPAPKPGDTAEKTKSQQPAKAPEKTPTQFEFTAFTGKYQAPPLSLLESYEDKNAPLDREVLLSNSRLLERKLADFGVDGRVVEVRPGPVITMYEYEPAPGIKINRIVNLADDLSLALRATAIRIVAPIPGKGAVGIEVPNTNREIVHLKEILESEPFQQSPSQLTLAMGKDISGTPIVTDLCRMPHLLVAGTTGSGKSVFLNSVICSLLYKTTPDEVRLIMVDPKRLELMGYDGIPHLYHPVVTEPKKASAVLKWAVAEMENRYNIMAKMGVRNIDSYNRKVDKENKEPQKRMRRGSEDDGTEFVVEEEIIHRKLPYVVAIIDEFSDLMMIAPKDIEESVARLAQMARAAGIHIILATQRPSVDVITGSIKANFPARISFRVSSRIDSRTILDGNGAESLLGAGDMLFLPPTSSNLVRMHGAFVTEQEVRKMVDFLKQSGEPTYDESIFDLDERGGEEEYEDVYDEKYEDAKRLVYESERATISYIQRILRIGYNRAARMIERMEREGFIGPADHTGNREIYRDRFYEK